MQIAVLAGGLGTRLYPLTRRIPKAMVSIEGKPFLEYQIELLKKNKINDILLCVGYKFRQIKKYFGNGRRFGVKIRYSIEEKDLLGTAGSLKKAQRYLKKDFIVIYGDSYLPIDLQKVVYAYKKSRKPALMTVFRNKNKLDKSNVKMHGKKVVLYDKNSKEKLDYIDYGLTVLKKKLIEELPKNKILQLDSIFEKLAAAGQLAAYEVKKPFYEIGSQKGLERFREYISKETAI
jgi:N-acetyl-alpha-D-muramate 1-phosphate uridylyltransferase